MSRRKQSGLTLVELIVAFTIMLILTSMAVPLARSKVRAERAGRVRDLVLELCDASAAITEDYFTKIVDELLENAFKFSSPGSPVRVQTTTNGGHFTLRIADHGRGMKVEHIAEVGAYMQFERKIYEQQGSGLGLTIAKRLTELHGGDLNIQSEIGVGTTAEVTLPCLTLH